MLHAKHCVKDGATGVVMTKGNVIVGMSLSFLFDSGAVDLKVLVPADHHSFEYSGFFVCSWTCKFLRGLDLPLDLYFCCFYTDFGAIVKQM